jgi:hypothetical protein
VEELRKDIERLRMIKEYPELLRSNQELQAQNVALSKENSQLKATNGASPQPAIPSAVVDALRGPWQIVCDRCSATFSAEFTTSQVEALCRTGYVELECSTPGCAQVGKRVRRSLRGLVGTSPKSKPSTFRYSVSERFPKDI